MSIVCPYRIAAASIQRVLTAPARKSGWASTPTTARGGLDALDVERLERPRSASAPPRGRRRGRSASPAASRSRARSSSRGSRRCRPARRRAPGTPSARAGRGRRTVGDVLGVDAALDRVAAKPTSLLANDSGSPPAIAQLLADQVAPGDHLGDRVLDLDAGVDLEEAGSPLSASTRNSTVPRCGSRAPRRTSTAAAERVAGSRGQRRRRRLLDHLLVAALERAVAVAEVDDLAVPSAATWTSTWRAWRRSARGRGGRRRTRAGLAAAAARAAPQLVAVAREHDPATAAAAGRLEQHRVADPLGDRASSAASPTSPARQHRHPGAARRARARGACRRRSIASAEGPTNAIPSSRARGGELRALGQEAVAGVERVAAGAERGQHDDVVTQVALARRRRGRCTTARSASRAASLPRSASETATTVSRPAPRQARTIRTAISPRLATNTRLIRFMPASPGTAAGRTRRARRSRGRSRRSSPTRRRAPNSSSS